MSAHTASHAEMDFSKTERSHLASAFNNAFEKLKQSMPSDATAECETNNHFDEEFHNALAGGLHLRKKFV